MTAVIAGLLILVANAQRVIVYPTRPQPEWENPSFCPPEGKLSDRSDPELNSWKNRIDRHKGEYQPVALINMQNLYYPKGVGKRKRSEWTSEQRIDVGRYEGLPVYIEGYLALTSVRDESLGAKVSGGGSWNCGLTDDAHVDYILWVTSVPEESKANAIVAVVTPRFRAKQGFWTIQNLTRIAKGRYRVRIYGWLMLDQEHTGEVGKSRATLWEIHPITQIMYQEQRKWENLESREPLPH